MENLCFLANNSLQTSLRAEYDQRIERLRHAVAASLRSECHDPDPWFLDARDSRRGQRCFLLGCGPSLNQVDLARLRGENIMAVNGSAFIKGIIPDYFVTVSNYFWKSHQEKIKELPCRRFIPEFLRKHLESDSPTVWLNTIADNEYAALGVNKPWKFSYRPHQHIFLGGTVIFVCLQILFHLGYDEVIILGLDHDYGIDPSQVPREGLFVNSDNLKAHFSNDYYRAGEQVHIDIYGMERGYSLAKRAFDSAGRKVTNASPGTKLDIFEKIDFDRIL